MDIKPRDLKIQLFGNMAIATFHLDDRAGILNRRTIVLKKANAGWKLCTCTRPSTIRSGETPRLGFNGRAH